MKIAVIGESNIDIAVAPHTELNAKGCVPGNIDFHHGGVARNIAHNLCLLGHDVKLVSVFGGDDFAERMVADCKQIGMDLSLSDQFKEAKSPIFLSFNDNTGNMVSAVSDVSLNDYMDLDWLKDKMAAINTSDVVVADTLLSTNALAYLIDHCEVPLFVDTVSPGKAVRFADALKLCEKRLIRPHRITLCDGCPFGIEPLCLSPLIAKHIIGELRAVKSRRRWQALDEVGQLLCAEIQLNIVVLCLDLKAAAKQNGGYHC